MSLLKTNAIQTVAGKPILNSTGSILQVVSNFSNTLLSGTADFDIISQSITPTSTDSQILIMFNCSVSQDSTSGAEWGYQIQRNGTPIRIGTTLGTARPLTFMAFGTDNYPSGSTGNANIFYSAYTMTGVLTDSPGTTSAVTYKARVIHANGATNVLVGRTGWSGTTTEQLTVGYSITLMEVSG
jgi:hypothetical protein